VFDHFILPTEAVVLDHASNEFAAGSDCTIPFDVGMVLLSNRK